MDKKICWNWKDKKAENVSVPIHTDKQTDRQGGGISDNWTR